MAKNTAVRRRHIATIADVLALAERTERELQAQEPAVADDIFHGLLRVVAGSIVDAWVGCSERWCVSDGWTDAGMRAFVLAYATHAPDAELAEAAAIADERRDWCVGYAIATRYAIATGSDLKGAVDLEALARAARGEARKASAPIATDAMTEVQH